MSQQKIQPREQIGPLETTRDTLAETLDSLSEQFLLEHRLGVGESIEEFCRRYPDCRDRIEREFPQLLQIELAYQEYASEDPIPTQIGKYALGDEIGRGGMGLVYSATHTELDTEVAIKILHTSRTKQGRNLERFQAEARACAAMEHPNIIPVHDFGIENGFAYFAMKRIDGPTLANIVSSVGESPPLSWEQIARIGLQAASALDYAHGLGIIHRDVKPANLMLDRRGKLWLSDFGLAKLRELEEDEKADFTDTGEIVGTARYMAPERFRGVCSETSDIYGLGLTLYELAAQRKVWREIEDLVSFTDRRALPSLREVNPSVPEPLADIIMKASSLHPEERYQSAKELCFVLSRFLGGNSKAERRATHNNARRRWRRKDVLMAGIVAGAAAICLTTHAVVSEVQKNAQASAEQIAASFEEQLSQPLEKISGKELFESEDRDVRSATVDLVKAIALQGLEVSAEERNSIDQEFDSIMKNFVDSGYDAYVREQKTDTDNIWHMIPGLQSVIEQSNLSPDWKEYSDLLLTTLSEKDARRKVSKENQNLFRRAFHQLEQRIPGQKGLEFATEEQLVLFIREISDIQLSPSLKSLGTLFEGLQSQ